MSSRQSQSSHPCAVLQEHDVFFWRFSQTYWNPRWNEIFSPIIPLSMTSISLKLNASQHKSSSSFLHKLPEPDPLPQSLSIYLLQASQPTTLAISAKVDLSLRTNIEQTPIVRPPTCRWVISCSQVTMSQLLWLRTSCFNHSWKLEPETPSRQWRITSSWYWEWSEILLKRMHCYRDYVQTSKSWKARHFLVYVHGVERLR